MDRSDRIDHSPEKLARSAMVVVGFIVAFILASRTAASFPASEGLKKIIADCKKDVRGPYSGIGWFCPDGRILPASSRCDTPGGIQHGVLKPELVQLAATEGIYWGQILAGAKQDAFLDAGRHFSRLKQYQLERYLQRIDDGWILRKARYYRGAVQFEDESRWGKDFLRTQLADDHLLETQFFLLLQAVRDIPHFTDDGRWKTIRARSQAIAEAVPAFMPFRIKLHGQPDPADMDALNEFLTTHGELPSALREEVRLLIQDLENVYQTGEEERLEPFLHRLSRESPSYGRLIDILATLPVGGVEGKIFHLRDLAAFLLELRMEMRQTDKPSRRLVLADLSTAVQDILFFQTMLWQPETVDELLDKIAITALGCTGAGYLEMWEWGQVAHWIDRSRKNAEDTDLTSLSAAADAARRIAEWGTAMVRAHYGALTNRWRTFEPLAAGFIDDRVRSGLLLPLGDAIAGLQRFVDGFDAPASQVMGLADTSRIRGVNAGYACGVLRVLDHVEDHTALSAADIVILPNAPPDLKPVAGIATVSEGNPVSHVQLLARNLGIPNAILSAEELHALKTWDGQPVFYAVSPGGSVLMKPVSEMTDEERLLVESRPRDIQRIHVPLGRIDLSRMAPVPLDELTAADSGRWCGPKAASLGQLKHDFPDHVVDGFAIPFGAFRRHMDQSMPGTDGSFWTYLQETFDSQLSEATILVRLARLHAAIGDIPLLPEFAASIRHQFFATLGAGMDDLPVFVRSDTNMEDLKDFTGAGLNLTVFNVRGERQIFQAIRDVWASVYTERSFRWRQQLLINAENVFPSILILPSVDVEKSGVMITTGVGGGAVGDITVAFSRGAGGAVEGQAAETHRLLAAGGSRLLSPAREPLYTVLPRSGGVTQRVTGFDRPILSGQDLDQLRSMATIIRERMADRRQAAIGPWDVELGFRDGRIWLFQARPYVENRNARATTYLNRLDPQPPVNRSVPLWWRLPWAAGS